MHDDTPPIRVPEALAPLLDRFFGPEWTQALPTLTQRQLRHWNLQPTATPMHGMVALVVPVRRTDATPAMLKIQPVDAESEGEPHALRTWNGDGAVRLLQHDPDTGAMLLEPLDPTRTLDPVPIDEALTTIGTLLARLTSHRAPQGMRTLADTTRAMVTRAHLLAPRLRTAHERDRISALTARAREMAPEAGDRLLHWDLHFQNVLAPLPGTDREPWLAIDPKPLAGDPGFDLFPTLHNRWDEALATGDPRKETRRRLDLVSEAAHIPRDRARAWTLVRVLQECVWAVEDGDHTLPRVPVTIAEALGA
ncbi:aminoglycoside phosphotransferase family protein [Nocardiopsis synnemataformans]|uniref:aminoglycoside phosphotransferase family protein n=1 Tax=Nocardiopsis synnemataformans TaxID=61305 RepID=UPI003EBDA5C8